MPGEKMDHKEKSMLDPDGHCLDKIPARLILYLLSLTGLIINYMICNDINLTILAMVKYYKKAVPNNTETDCYSVDNNFTESALNYTGTLEWSQTVQSSIIGSFYWTHICSHIVGGAVTQKYGTKRVFGFVQLTCALCNYCIPFASETHYGIVIALRCIQGIASGFMLSTVYAIIGYWIPTHERSLFLSCLQGISFGVGLSYTLAGFIIAKFSWRIVFYCSGSLGLVWCIMWYYFAFDTPDEHPRISYKEKEYIKQYTNSICTIRQRKVIPWTSILRCMGVWATVIATLGRVWFFYTIIFYGPQYMKHILGFSIEKNGFLSGSPYLTCFISTLTFGYIADQIIQRKLLTKGTTRKVFTFIGLVVPSVISISICYVGCNTTIIIILYFFAINMASACIAGVLSGIVDIAPNFSGVVITLCQTLFSVSGIVIPIMAGYITRDGHTLSAYRTIFTISAGVGIGTWLIYQIWGTSEVQSWNDVQPECDPEECGVILEDVKTTKKILILSKHGEDV